MPRWFMEVDGAYFCFHMIWYNKIKIEIKDNKMFPLIFIVVLAIIFYYLSHNEGKLLDCKLELNDGATSLKFTW